MARLYGKILIVFAKIHFRQNRT